MTGLDALQAITDIGESIVLGVVALSVSVYLLLIGRRMDAAFVAATYAGTAVMIALLKLIFISCGHDVLNIRSPSGHTALSVAALGAVAWLCYRDFAIPGKIAAFAFGVLIATIAVSRIILHYHSIGEAVLGALVGCLSTVFCYRIALHGARRCNLKNGKRPINFWVLGIVVVGAMAATYGHSIPAEQEVTTLATRFRLRLPFCR